MDITTRTFSSLDNKALLAGGNPLAIETASGMWKILQFGTAALHSPGRWKLTHLLRGQFDAECSIAEPALARPRVVVLNADVTPVMIGEGDIGRPGNWRIGPSTVAAANPLNPRLAFTPSERGLRSFSPAHLHGVPQQGARFAHNLAATHPGTSGATSTNETAGT